MRVTLRRGLAIGAVAGAAAFAIPAASVFAENGETPKIDCDVEKLPTPKGFPAAVATYVSGSGEHIVGNTRHGDSGQSVPVIWADGKAKIIEELKSDDTWPESVNNSGQIIGNHINADDSGTVPWVYQDGEVVDLKVGNGQSAFANDINDSGQIVGYVFEEEGDEPKQAAIWESIKADPLILDAAEEKAEAGAFAIDTDGTVTGYQGIPGEKATRLWAWGPEGGKGEELKRPAVDDAEDVPKITQIRGGHVISQDVMGVPGYKWNLAEPGEGVETEIAHPVDVNPDGTIVGFTKDNDAAALTADGTVKLPNADEPSEEQTHNMARSISDSGEVIVGNGVTGKDKLVYVAAKWTCAP